MPAKNTYVDTFKAFAHLHDQGRVSSIGVSNFEPEHLRILIDATGIVACRQPGRAESAVTAEELREEHAQLGIATEAWAPLVRDPFGRSDRDGGLGETRKNACPGTD